jgi:hypothetical protein
VTHRLVSLAFLPLVLSVALGCGVDEKGTEQTGGASGKGADGGGSGGLPSIDASTGDGGSSACMPPDVLIVMDRSSSMTQAPDGTDVADTPAGHAESKWAIAIAALEAATAAYSDAVRFGLVLLPRDPGALACVTLSDVLGGRTATNVKCEEADLLVEPALSTAAAIASALDPETTRMCNSTPIGKAFERAGETLAKTGNPANRQFVVLITDGQDSCDEGLMVSEAQKLAKTGASIYAIGFDASAGAGIDVSQLNDVACAGRTAQDFTANCKDDGAGNYVARLSGAPPFFMRAEDGQAIVAAIDGISKSVCCDCVR